MADLKEQGLERVPIIVENVVATASNMHTGTIFWSDMKLKKISRLDKSSEPKDVSEHSYSRINESQPLVRVNKI